LLKGEPRRIERDLREGGKRKMESWTTSIFSALVAATLTLCIREFIEYLKSPRLKIDFERSKNEYPHIQNYFDESMVATSTTFRILYLRLVVSNKGNSTANDCEAKLELISTQRKTRYMKSLHWSKRDPRIYKTLDQIYSPINLNKNDEETVDILQLQYSHTSTDPEPRPNPHIETVSPSALWLYKDEEYYVKITIYARNTTSLPFYFKVKWNGTKEGFYTAFKKVRNFPKEHSS
jgi:hypothetical protein